MLKYITNMEETMAENETFENNNENLKNNEAFEETGEIVSSNSNNALIDFLKNFARILDGSPLDVLAFEPDALMKNAITHLNDTIDSFLTLQESPNVSFIQSEEKNIDNWIASVQDKKIKEFLKNFTKQLVEDKLGSLTPSTFFWLASIYARVSGIDEELSEKLIDFAIAHKSLSLNKKDTVGDFIHNLHKAFKDEELQKNIQFYVLKAYALYQNDTKSSNQWEQLTKTTSAEIPAIRSDDDLITAFKNFSIENAKAIIAYITQQISNNSNLKIDQSEYDMYSKFVLAYILSTKQEFLKGEKETISEVAYNVALEYGKHAKGLVDVVNNNRLLLANESFSSSIVSVISNTKIIAQDIAKKLGIQLDSSTTDITTRFIQSEAGSLSPVDEYYDSEGQVDTGSIKMPLNSTVSSDVPFNINLPFIDPLIQPEDPGIGEGAEDWNPDSPEEYQQESLPQGTAALSSVQQYVTVKQIIDAIREMAEAEAKKELADYLKKKLTSLRKTYKRKTQQKKKGAIQIYDALVVALASFDNSFIQGNDFVKDAQGKEIQKILDKITSQFRHSDGTPEFLALQNLAKQFYQLMNPPAILKTNNTYVLASQNSMLTVLHYVAQGKAEALKNLNSQNGDAINGLIKLAEILKPKQSNLKEKAFALVYLHAMKLTDEDHRKTYIELLKAIETEPEEQPDNPQGNRDALSAKKKEIEELRDNLSPSLQTEQHSELLLTEDEIEAINAYLKSLETKITKAFSAQEEAQDIIYKYKNGGEILSGLYEEINLPVSPLQKDAITKYSEKVTKIEEMLQKFVESIIVLEDSDNDKIYTSVKNYIKSLNAELLLLKLNKICISIFGEGKTFNRLKINKDDLIKLLTRLNNSKKSIFGIELSNEEIEQIKRLINSELEKIEQNDSQQTLKIDPPAETKDRPVQEEPTENDESESGE